MPLLLRYGQATATGPKSENQDALRLVTPVGGALVSKGNLFLLADGVSHCTDGKLASESSASAVAADYFATPETWGVSESLDKVLKAQNSWLQAQARGGALLTTLSALVLRGGRYTIAHVGDSRVYRYYQNVLKCCTAEHVWTQPGLGHVLKRALGLDAHLVVDFLEGELTVGERFLLCSDGVWEPLGDARIHEILHLHQDVNRAAEALVQGALRSGGRDNASAIVIEVMELPERGWLDEVATLAELAIPPLLKAGQVFEGLEVREVLHASRHGLLYRVIDAQGRPWLLKTLTPEQSGDEMAAQALLLEEWLQRRLTSHYFPEIHVHEGRRSLYFLLKEYTGETLSERFERNGRFSIQEISRLGVRLGKALSALHRMNIVHRDIKPENLHWGQDERLRVLDLGIAYCPGLVQADHATDRAGTPSFLPPERFQGVPADFSSDLYAAGVSLYYLLTGQYPYGEVEPFQTPRFGDPVPASRYRPDTPLWLDNLLLKAVAREPQARFETAEEWGVAFEKSDKDPVSVVRRTPLLDRNPLRVWQTVGLISLALNLVFLLVLLSR